MAHSDAETLRSHECMAIATSRLTQAELAAWHEFERVADELRRGVNIEIPEVRKSY